MPDRKPRLFLIACDETDARLEMKVGANAGNDLRQGSRIALLQGEESNRLRQTKGQDRN